MIHFKKSLLFLLFLAGGITVSAQNAAPQIIPAVKEWRGSSGSFSFKKQTKIGYQASHQTLLQPILQIFANDLKTAFGLSADVLSNADIAKNDIIIQLKPNDTSIKEEEYRINILSDKINITARTAQGVTWATKSLLQMLHNHGNALPCGEIKDFPDYPNRGFMLDVGRKFFTIDYLRNYVKILSYYKFNEFQIHLNDNGFPEYFDNDWDKTYSAFRLESDWFPGLTAKDGHYTKAEFRDLQRLGQQYGVNIIPEIDIPAHSLAFAHYRPELGSDKYGRDHLDLYNPNTYTFLDSLYKEYITGENPVFIGPDVHIGTDEYDVRESEKYREFTDRYLKYIQSLGKQVRMWGGLRWLKGKTPVHAKDVIMNAWSYDWVDPFQSLKDGFKLISTCDIWLYIVPATGYYREFLDTEWLYTNWKPEKINSKETLPDGTPGLIGGMFAVWNDHSGNGISEKDVHIRTMPAIKVLSERMWKRLDGSEKQSLAKFLDLSKKQIEAPGINLAAKFPLEKTLDSNRTVLQYALSSNKEKDISGNAYHEVKRKNVKRNKAQKSLRFNGNSFLQTALPEIGYEYNVDFDLKPAAGNASNAVLFNGKNSVITLNTNGGGKLGFSRDGYTYTFNYTPQPNEWSAIGITGDWKGTSLYVNGKLVERLQGKTKLSALNKHGRKTNMYIQETLFFPLQFIGSATNGFKGEMRNLKVVQK